MGDVPYEDDDRRRFVLRRYVFDPLRHERRNTVVAVVDNRREFESLFARHREDLRRRAAEQGVDPREHLIGIVMERGHLARAANGHLMRRAVQHGVLPAWVQSLDLPSNIAVLRADESENDSASGD